MSVVTEFENKLLNISKPPIVPLSDGHDDTIAMFYRNCISKNLPTKECVDKWNDLLFRYISDPEAVFFFRKYASAPKKDWSLIRRGFLTEYLDGTWIVYCDNFFAHYFFKMALDGFVPKYEDFVSAMRSFKIPYGFMVASEEKPLQAFSKGKSPGINNRGWKLAHIYGVNSKDYPIDTEHLAPDFLDRGDRGQWEFDCNYGVCIRRINRSLTPAERSIITKHFIRLVHPANYFLVPKTRLETDYFGSNVGENNDLIKYVACQFHKLYEASFDQMESCVSCIKTDSNNLDFYGSKFINVSYGPNLLDKIRNGLSDDAVLVSLDDDSLSKVPVTKETPSFLNEKSLAKNKPSKCIMTELQLAEMAKRYLENADSFRTLEIDVLGLESPARGGGFIAKKALNDFGITVKEKGILADGNLNEVYQASTGVFREALYNLYFRNN